MRRVGALAVATLLVACHKNGPSTERHSLGDVPLYPGSRVVSTKGSGVNIRAVVNVPAPASRLVRYYRNVLFRGRWSIEPFESRAGRTTMEATRGLDRLELVVEALSRRRSRLILRRRRRTEAEVLAQDARGAAARTSSVLVSTRDATGAPPVSDPNRATRIVTQSHIRPDALEKKGTGHAGGLSAPPFALRLPKDIHAPDGWRRYRDPRLGIGVTFRNESRDMASLVRGIVQAMTRKGWSRVAASGKVLGGTDFRVVVFSKKNRMVTMRLTRGLDGTYMRILLVTAR